MKKLTPSLKAQAIRMYNAWMRGERQDRDWVIGEIANTLGISKSSLLKLWKTK